MTRPALPVNVASQRHAALRKEAAIYGERYVERERRKGLNYPKLTTAAGIFANYLATEALLRGEAVQGVVERLWPELADDAWKVAA